MLPVVIPFHISGLAWKPSNLNWKDFWDIAAHVGQLLGLCGAGVWAYFNFVVSRIYYARIELSVTGEIREADNRRYLVPRITLKNIGKSQVHIDESASGYKVCEALGAVNDRDEMIWSGGENTVQIFEGQGWIEADETMFDESWLLPLSPLCIAVKIEVRVVSVKDWLTRTNSEWNCTTVVGPKPREEIKANDTPNLAV